METGKSALPQKMKARAALKRIDSRMKLLNLYPALDEAAVVQMRLEAFRKHFGAERHFIEAFR